MPSNDLVKTHRALAGQERRLVGLQCQLGSRGTRRSELTCEFPFSGVPQQGQSLAWNPQRTRLPATLGNTHVILA